MVLKIRFQMRIQGRPERGTSTWNRKSNKEMMENLGKIEKIMWTKAQVIKNLPGLLILLNFNKNSEVYQSAGAPPPWTPRKCI